MRKRENETEKNPSGNENTCHESFHFITNDVWWKFHCHFSVLIAHFIFVAALWSRLSVFISCKIDVLTLNFETPESLSPQSVSGHTLKSFHLNSSRLISFDHHHTAIGIEIISHNCYFDDDGRRISRRIWKIVTATPVTWIMLVYCSNWWFMRSHRIDWLHFHRKIDDDDDERMRTHDFSTASEKRDKVITIKLPLSPLYTSHSHGREFPTHRPKNSYGGFQFTFAWTVHEIKSNQSTSK